MKRQWLKQALLLLLVALVPAVGAGLWHPGRPAWSADVLAEDEVRLDTALTWGEQALWLDGRPRSEFEKARVPGALLLNEDEWDDLLMPVLAAWQPDQKVVIYCDDRICQSGRNILIRFRQEAGLYEVYLLKGGWQAWQQSGQQVER